MEILYFNHSLSNKRKYFSHKPQFDTDKLVRSLKSLPIFLILFELRRNRITNDRTRTKVVMNLY